MSSDSPENTGLQIQRESGLAKLPNNESSALTEIIKRSLVHIQTSKALAVRHRVGEHELCEPDYKLVCALAEDLRYSPERVLTQLMDTSSNREGYINGKLVWQTSSHEASFLDQVQNENPSTIVDGQFKSLLVMGHKLPIAAMPCIAGLSINKLTLHCYPGDKGFDIDFRFFPDLTELYCYSVYFNNLELEHVPHLKILKCNDSNLGELDLSVVPNLNVLYCRYNQLTNLDLSPVPNLEILDCGHNCLEKLDLSGVPKLIELRCDNNEIEEIDIRNLTGFKLDPYWGLDDLLRGKEVRVIKRRDQ